MKTFTPLQFIGCMLISLLSYTSIAQNYSFTLVQNSDYNFTISAVSQFDSGSFQPITQSYGFVLVLPDGISITVDNVLPTGASETVTSIPGTNVAALDPSMSDKDLFLITTDTSGALFNAHADGTTIPLITITVNGNPSTGEIRILDNNSILASHPAINGSLDAFIQVDVTDDSTVNFNNEFDKLNGDEAFSFETLSTETPETFIADVTLFPNPAKDEVTILSEHTIINYAEIFNIHGQRIMKVDNPLSAIDVSQLESAVYLVKIYSETGANKTIKLIKE
ncbi:T9SS type A sorting domain-containing protein [uncultured Psychroserpens sp.]|uniref:T9SS type A sorting domain-containing protein n=1 Tax=uncultured Psychroserpens sp. TaxID=255436 RepID=UPI00261C5DF2|nr:T9SS type A sorting domain-containing protein [uncultured Psychroserpens sp.]